LGFVFGICFGFLGVAATSFVPGWEQGIQEKKKERKVEAVIDQSFLF
jgi:hypothetical protein